MAKKPEIDELWSVVSSYSDRQQTTVTVPGILEAAQNGCEQLHSYLNSRAKPYDDYYRKATLEIALSLASERGLSDVLRTLLDFSVDPNVPMLPLARGKWHPVARAANLGQVDTLRILLTSPRINIRLLEYQLDLLSDLDIYALREMESSELDQILRLLSTLDISATTRNNILLKSLELPRHHGPDLELANRLIEHGFACWDPVNSNESAPNLLESAIERGCNIRALKYLVEQDMRVLSGSTTGGLVRATLLTRWVRHGECLDILEFLTTRIEGVEAYVRQNSSSLLSSFLLYRLFHSSCERNAGERGKTECDTMATVKLLLDLGATLDARSFSRLIPHANECFMLGMVKTVPDIEMAYEFLGLEQAISSGQFNLAVALVERGVHIYGNQARHVPTILQHTCREGAPLWLIRFLVDNGADVNAPPHGGLTALQFAVEHGSMNMVGLLLDSGADVNALDDPYSDSRPQFFRRSLDYAVQYSRLDMVHFLIAAGARSGWPGSTGLYGAVLVATRQRKSAIGILLRQHAQSNCGERMEAERQWLLANPDMCMVNGKIIPKSKLQMAKSEKSESESWHVDEMELGAWAW